MRRLTKKVMRKLRVVQRPSARQDDALRLTEHLLALQLQEAVASKGALNWHDVGFRIFSQNEEDGLLLYLFALLGTTSRFLIDIGSRAVEGSNATNLLLHHGWGGVLIDEDPTAAARLRAFYASQPNTWMLPPSVLARRVTAQNVNDLLREADLPAEVDLLSIDIDGIDYWVWKTLEITRPRVIVAEMQVIWDADRSVTVPNDPHFHAIYRDGFGVYSGASVTAFTRLADLKGYELVGSNRLGYNAFFVRRDILPSALRPVAPHEVTSLPFPRTVRARYLAEVQKFEWVEV